MSFDYYSLPCTKEPFDGQVIKLTGEDFDYLFQNYTQTSEDKFREKLSRMDDWLSTKHYKLYANNNWVNWVIKWLQPKEEKDDG